MRESVHEPTWRGRARNTVSRDDGIGGAAPDSPQDANASGPTASAGPRVVDVPDARRYELWAHGERVGFAAYRREPGRVVFTHTVVDPEQEGHGYGSTIARAVIADAVGRGETIVPQCPFLSAWLEKHPDAATDVDWPERP
jgi:predicted GNAT family acetyltransferase